ncbi:MAG: radical SAM protein [Bryobacteraceae bacterium]|nr:radical SAM protein [Bryobacterales bacterium]MEB2361671.1 radical SAM protein [Bryobacterales bacterium]NUN00127.1 radical SAM protein [Bryobacteraceae bacterium]
MRAWNRAKLLWGYLRRKSEIGGLPVEFIVETTAKCNLYCPMCPRETHKQPKADMADHIFERLVRESGKTGEHMMLIGLGEPFMDRRIFDRIEYCERHGISTLLSTNGTFLDEKMSERILESTLEHITLSFDGATKESYEYYRKGAKFEKVRENFVRFARMKHERKSKMQIVVQMVRMERNWDEVEEFTRFWRAVPGVDQVRIKADETNVLDPASAHAAEDWKYPCHYLWRGPLYVKQNGDVYPCCQSYMLDGAPVGNIETESLDSIWNSVEMQRMRRLHAEGRAGEIDICSRCCTTIPHPALVAGSLLLHGRTVRRLLPLVERLAYFSKMPARLLRPPKPPNRRQELVQISGPPGKGSPADS